MTEAPYFYSYFIGRGRELLAEVLSDSSPFTLPGSEIVQRVLNAGYGPDFAHVQRTPFPTGKFIAPVSHEGQTFLVSSNTGAETISVQEERAKAYEVVEWRPLNPASALPASARVLSLRAWIERICLIDT